MVDWLDGLAVRDSEIERMRRALLSVAEDASNSGAWAWRLDDGFTLWSAGMFRIWELEPREVVDRELIEASVHFRDRGRRHEWLSAVRRGQEMPELHFRVLLGGERFRFVASSAVVRLDSHHREVLIGWVRDITDSRQAAREIACHVAVTSALTGWDGSGSGVAGLLEELASALGFARGSFWVPEGEVLVPRYQSYEDRDELSLTGTRLEAGQGLAGMAWSQREPVWSGSLTDEPDYPFHDLAVRAHVRGALAFPIVSGEEVLAVIALSGAEDFELTARLSATLTGIGYEVGSFLANRTTVVRPTVLTPREVEIMRLASEGVSGPQIARRLFVSPTTVKTHFENIYVKYEVTDRVAAVAKAMREGLLS